MKTAVQLFFRRYFKRVLLLAVVLFSIAGFAYCETVPGDLKARFADEPHFVYQDETYRLRRRLTTVLIAGTDQGVSSQGYALGARNGGQADFLMLVVIDDANKTITPIQINRDTMTEITILNVMGDVSGSRVAQICLAHAFGDGKERSCELLESAVSNFLLGTPIDHYFVMKFEGLGALNDVIGGVEVTLEDDFSEFDPEMVPGKRLTLNASQTEIYLRQRFYVGDQTNISRQRRQQTYIRAAADTVMARINASSGFIDTLMDAIGENAVTDMSRGRMINMANTARRYQVEAIRSIEGETSVGDDGFVQFYHDEDALINLLIEVLYERVD